MLPRLSRFRSFSSSLSNTSIYISTSTSPYFNLSVEDWLFRKTPQERPLLLLYRNNPCVVIGRNQNPWKEINFPALHALGVPFIRRRSGGGTVYHDLGNTNFSIHLPRTSFNRHHTTRLVNRGVRALGIDAEVNERNDICVGGFKMSTDPSHSPSAWFFLFMWKYVSGSAYKIVSSRAYHHGTMLISTELEKLGNVLRNTKEGMVTKGVASVRSPVHNLRQFKPEVTHSAFLDAVIAEFVQEYKVNPEVKVIHEDEDMRSVDHIRDGIVELQQWDWQYGQTPEFTHKLSRKFAWGDITADIGSKHGIILSCYLQCSNGDEQGLCDGLAEALVGVRYASLEGLKEGDEKNISAARKQQDAIQWLREEM